MRFWNFSSRIVIGVAITSTRQFGFNVAAGFTAGSIPTIGISRYNSRNALTAALVAVLQATTRPFAPCANAQVQYIK